MAGAAFLALADDADERRVVTAAGQEVDGGIGAVIEQRGRDRHGIRRDGFERQPREAEIRERLPAFRPPVAPEEVVLAADAGAHRIGVAVGPRRPARIGPQRPVDGVDIATDDGGMPG